MTDSDVARWVSRSLVGGLVLSVAVLCVGAILAPLGLTHDRQVMALSALPHHLAAGRPDAFLDLGILILFATPLAGIAAALLGFAAQRDILFVGVTLLLLAIVGVGLVLAIR